MEEKNKTVMQKAFEIFLEKNMDEKDEDKKKTCCEQLIFLLAKW